MPFPCTKCGACCVWAGRLGLMPQREDGACKYLGEDNLCTIYETRPDICRIDVMRKRYGMDEKECYKLTASACNILQESLGIGSEFRVTIESDRSL